MSKSERKSFILYHSYANQLQLLSMEERGMLLTAIFEYDQIGEVCQPLSPMAAMAFSFIRDTLDRDRKEYEAACERQAINGKKGGRPKRSKEEIEAEAEHSEETKSAAEPEVAPKQSAKTQKTQCFSEKPKKPTGFFENPPKPKKPYNENDIENDSDIVLDNGNGNGNEKEQEGESPARTEPRSFVAPCSASAPPAPQEGLRPFPDEKEKRELLALGLTERYIEERLERAVAYGEREGKRASEVLLEWWRQDRETRGKMPRTRKRASPALSEKSYDTEDFFAAALARAERELMDG